MHYHRLNNLLWVWTTEAIPSVRSVEKYDHTNSSLLSSLYRQLNVKLLFNCKKMIALSENGGLLDPAKLVKDGAHWSWFLTWCGEMILNES
jgi:mannan endo-1,4-beta-mannosidase